MKNIYYYILQKIVILLICYIQWIFKIKNNKAPNYKVVSCNIDAGNDDIKFNDVIKEKESRLISVACVNDKLLLLKYNENVKHVIKLVDLKGNDVKNNIKFPSAGSIYFSCERQYNDIFFYFTSFLYPGTIYYYNFKDDKMNVFKEIKVKNFDASLYETKQIWYESKDKTKIPMYILLKKDVELNGNNPTILYGYGGYVIHIYYVSIFHDNIEFIYIILTINIRAYCILQI